MRWNLFDDEFGQWGKIVTDPRFKQHTDKQASDTESGHVKIDNDTIVKNVNGQIEVSDTLIQEIKDYADAVIGGDTASGGIEVSETMPTNLGSGNIWAEVTDDNGTDKDVSLKVKEGTSFIPLHPKTVAEQVVESTNKRFTSDFELDNKVDKVAGKQLSTEDYTTVEKGKLAGIQDGANNYVHPSTHDVSEITGLATVAISGDYSELINKPTGTSSGYDVGNQYNQIPLIQSDGKLDSTIIPSIAITDTYVVNSQNDMLALDVQVGDVAVRTDIDTTYILKQLPPTDLSSWQEILTPLSSVVQSVNGKTGSVVIEKLDLGLENVDNTSDMNKPISIATQNALDNKVDIVVGKQLSTEDFTTTLKTKLENLKDNPLTNTLIFFTNIVNNEEIHARIKIPHNSKITQVETILSNPSVNNLSYFIEKSVDAVNFSSLNINENVLSTEVIKTTEITNEVLLNKNDILRIVLSSDNEDVNGLTVSVKIEEIK